MWYRWFGSFLSTTPFLFVLFHCFQGSDVRKVIVVAFVCVAVSLGTTVIVFVAKP